MIYVTTVNDSKISLNYRYVKTLVSGKSNVQEVDEVAPYGTDSCPIKGTDAVYAQTIVKGQPVIIGYLNSNQKAKAGEYRIYSTDTSGTQQGEIWLHGTGLISIKNQEQSLLTNLENLINHLTSFMTNVNTGFADLFATIGSPPPSVNADIVTNIAQLTEDLTNIQQLLQ